MRARTGMVLPPARTAQLVIQDLPDEVLVYDLERHKAHCLNKTSALVWKHCDGRTTIEEVARRLEKEFGTTVGDDVVQLALAQLRRFRLLEEDKFVALSGRARVSRRDLVSKYLPAALVLPLILSIPSPTAAQASSMCVSGGNPCTFGGAPCCAGFACNETANGNLCTPIVT